MPSYIDNGPSLVMAREEGPLDFYQKSCCQGGTELTHLAMLSITKFLDIISLVDLDLSHCELIDFPTQLAECKSLQSLNMSHNILDKASCNLSLFPSLTRLDLSHNRLTWLHPSLSMVPLLSYLSVSHNQLNSLPDNMASISTIRQLFLDNNMLTTIPCWVSKLRMCSIVSLSNNPLEDLPNILPDIGNTCRRLKYLDLSNTSISSLPIALCKLLDLRHLNLSNNKYGGVSPSSPHLNSLVSLPTQFSNLVGLVKFQAVGVNLSELPDSFHLLINLEILDISNNCIMWLPTSLSLLPKLKFVNISKNIICLLPLRLDELPSLEHLLASSNRISELPDKLEFNDKLVTLDMYDNMLTEVKDMLILGGIVRCDFAFNFFNIEHLDEHILDVYRSKEKMLRQWREDDLGEGYICSIPDGLQRSTGHKEIETVSSSEKPEEWDEHYRIFVDENGEELEEEQVYKDEDKLSIVNQESVVGKPTHEDEDWASEADIYDLPTKFFFRHNLKNMHLEDFWGKYQFCPSDQHAQPRDEKILEIIENEERMLRQSKVGRQPSFSSVFQQVQDHQFDDAEE